ncbi:MAG: hypothetical protein QXJ93_01080 [Candidatus Rehaiarchaeum fermentans]|nr:hypothetical protein [Candidatus Rehaiarchaeum fermentans]
MNIENELRLRQEIKNLLRRSASDILIVLDDFKNLGNLVDFDLYVSNIDIIIKRLQSSIDKLKEYKNEF